MVDFPRPGHMYIIPMYVCTYLYRSYHCCICMYVAHTSQSNTNKHIPNNSVTSWEKWVIVHLMCVHMYVVENSMKSFLCPLDSGVSSVGICNT